MANDFLSAALMSALAARAISIRPARQVGRAVAQHGAHVNAYYMHMAEVEARAREDARVAAKRERDTTWISAANAKRARKAEKRRAIHERKEP